MSRGRASASRLHEMKAAVILSPPSHPRSWPADVAVDPRSHSTAHALLPGKLAQQELQAQFCIGLSEDLLDSTAFHFVRQGQVRGDDLPQPCQLADQTLDFLPLGSGEQEGSPVFQLLIVEPEVVLLRRRDLQDAVHGGVIEHMGFGPCFLKRLAGLCCRFQHAVNEG